MVKLYPEYGKFVDYDGYMYTVMKKTMYGCIQARSMWFDLLTKVLREFGYGHCPTDKCVIKSSEDTSYFCC
jgi:hypothetical protein